MRHQRMTQYRPQCGTHEGLMRHQSAGEAPCGKCREGELRRRLLAERAASLPSPPDPADGVYRLDIGEAEAAANLATLARALKGTCSRKWRRGR